MYDITALGEVLIDFTAAGISPAGQRLFEQNPGGAPANVLAVMSRYGSNTAFIGKVGQDMHGLFLRQTLEDLGIDCQGLIMDEQVFTTLAFVDLDAAGERTFSFARKPGADTMLRPDEIAEDTIKNSRILHLSSLSLTSEPSRSATLHAIAVAKENGVMISYDPNYRAPLWKSQAEAERLMKSVLPYVDILKLSDEEIALLTPEQTPEKAAAHLLSLGISLVAVTLGEKGALIATSEGSVLVEGFKSNVVDTNGAGDSFWGGFLYQMLKSDVLPHHIDLAKAATCARFGNAVASLCVQKRGCIPAIPAPEDVRALVANS